jgi:hypothetical protein
MDTIIRVIVSTLLCIIFVDIPPKYQRFKKIDSKQKLIRNTRKINFQNGILKNPKEACHGIAIVGVIFVIRIAQKKFFLIFSLILPICHHFSKLFIFFAIFLARRFQKFTL